MQEYLDNCSKKTYNSPEKLLENLCEHYNVPSIKIEYISEISLSKGRLAYDASVMYLNSVPVLDEEDFIPVVHHEFRHAWQKKYYPEIYKWWLKTNYDFYSKIGQYKYQVCELEIDAKAFGDSCGENTCEDVFDNFIPDKDYYLQKISDLRH